MPPTPSTSQVLKQFGFTCLYLCCMQFAWKLNAKTTESYYNQRVVDIQRSSDMRSDQVSQIRELIQRLKDEELDRKANPDCSECFESFF